MENPDSFCENEDGAAVATPFMLAGFEALGVPCTELVSEQTRRVIWGHFQDFSSRNLDGLMRHYAPGCRLVDDEETLEGIEAIRAYYANTLEQLAGENTMLRLLHLDIDHKVAFLTWEQYSDRMRIPFGATTFIVSDGLIIRQQLIACECHRGLCIHLY